MSIKQLSVFAENKSGKLAKIMKILSDNGIDVRAISVADSQDFGILRMIVSDTEKADAALRAANCISKINHVVSVSVPDAPGGLSGLLNVLQEHGIGIEYMYSLFSHAANEAHMIIRVEKSTSDAEKILGEKGYRIINEETIGIK